MKNYELKSFASDAELADAAAKDWLALLAKSTGPQSTAFSGGRIAKTLCSSVTKLVGASGEKLKNVEFYWADERCVPPDSPDSNFILAQQNLFQPLGIAENKIHRIKGELPPAEAVVEASAAIDRIPTKNKDGLPVLDLIFLGIGENGHTASLMPNVPEALSQSLVPYIHVKDSPKPPPNRISMTYALIAAAKEVWLLAAGSGKEDALRRTLQENGTTPMGRILQSRAKTIIYSDISI